MFRKRIPLIVAMLGLVALTASCGRKTDQQTSSSTPSPSAEKVSVTQVEMGRGVDAEKRVTERVEVFGPSDVIYASVITNGASPGATLKTRWTFEDGVVIEETEQSIAPNGPAATEFHISKPDGWPAGKYKLEVFLDGQPVQTQTFEVKPT